jgi:hypothetical protein
LERQPCGTVHQEKGARLRTLLEALNEPSLKAIPASGVGSFRFTYRFGSLAPVKVLRVTMHESTCTARAAITTGEPPRCDVRFTETELPAAQCEAMTTCLDDADAWRAVEKRVTDGAIIQEYDEWVEAITKDGYRETVLLDDVETKPTSLDECVERWFKARETLLRSKSDR